MIPSTEIKKIARTSGVPESTIERDYAQNWFLGSLFISCEGLVLKGGTGIRKTYIEGYRLSDDLDFTMVESFEKKALKDFILEAVKAAKEESGIDFGENIVLKENINGYEGVVYFRLIRLAGSPIGIKLDFTRPDMEKVLVPPLKKRIIHPYSDDCIFEVFVYTLEEIMAEKVRSLFERTRPRDLYDVWYFRDKLDKKIVSEIFSEKCKLKKLKPDIDSIIERREDFYNAWENSLGHQLKTLPEFSETYDVVLKKVKGFL